jgi:hypothetical protein
VLPGDPEGGVNKVKSADSSSNTRSGPVETGPDSVDHAPLKKSQSSEARRAAAARPRSPGPGRGRDDHGLESSDSLRDVSSTAGHPPLC